MSNAATLSKNERTGKWEAIFKGQVLAASNDKGYVIGNISSGRCVKANKVKVDRVEEAAGQMVVEGFAKTEIAAAAQVQERFTINERFEFLEGFVKMVAKRTSPSLVVTGEGGLGKTYTVHDALKASGLVNASDISSTHTDADGNTVDMIGIGTDSSMSESESRKYYTVIKGYSTAKGLYKLLYENRNRIVVFDDCDSILRDPVALNLLKGALDSYEKRIISWSSAGFIDDGLPAQFEFKGGVIFISNMPVYKVDQAIRSRSICVDLSMNVEQKLERMKRIIQVESFLPLIDMEVKETALEFLNEMKNVATEISFRTLIQVAKIANEGGNWKGPAEYCLTNAN